MFIKCWMSGMEGDVYQVLDEWNGRRCLPSVGVEVGVKEVLME